MTPEQKIWLDNLYKQRNDTAITLMNNFAVSNVWNSVIEKYSDQAHFIYELLQNADDSEATKSEFTLNENGLFFRHNGERHFWISNSETETEDKKNDKLGDINAITAVAQSNKNQSTIGKFGVGFKAVFQYTKTPHIYDRDFQFKIERFIVPVKLEQDIKREKTETVFYFPFNKEDMPKETAYSDILGKLKQLVFPTLFLANLKEVSWKTENENGKYFKETKLSKNQNDIFYEKIVISQKLDSDTISEKLFLFTKYIENHDHTYSVGFFLDENNKLKPKHADAFCFFPTKENTGLNFIIHAPFLLTDSRETIKRTESWNSELVENLADLAANSLLILKDLKLIDDDIIRIIPYRKGDFYNADAPKFFAPFYDRIIEKLQTEELLPSLNGEFASKENSYWAVEPDVTKLFSNRQLAQLVGNNNAKWVFPSIGRTENAEIRDYIDGGDERAGVNKEPNLIKSNLDFETKITNLINANFIQNQSIEWLHKFYAYFDGRSSYLKRYKTKPIFLDSNKQAVPAFEQENHEFHLVLFLPSTDYASSEEYTYIHPELCKNEKSEEFIRKFGIEMPSLKDEIYNRILPQYDNKEDIETGTHFQKFFKYYKNECPQSEIKSFIDLIKDKEFVSYKTKEDETTYRGKASEIYYPSDDLQRYFETKPNTKFVDLNDYHKFIDVADREILKEFLLEIGVNKLPKILPHDITNDDIAKILNLRRSTRDSKTIDKFIDGCDEILESINKNFNIEKSKLLWNILAELSNCCNNLEKELTGEHEYYRYGQQYQSFESIMLLTLKKNKWLANENGEFVAPYEITINELSDGYDRSNKQLIDLLCFKTGISLEQEKEIFVKNLSDEDFLKFREWLEKQKAPKIIQPHKKEEIQDTPTEQYEADEDEYTKPSDDSEKKRKELEKRLQSELEEITKEEELKRIAEESEKYSFAWFKAVLELEYLKSNETNSSGKAISVHFAKAELEKGTERTLVLKNLVSPHYIPIAIQDTGNINMKISYGKDETKTVTVEVTSVSEFTLRCRLKKASDIEDVDLENVTSVQIDIKNPDFILEQLLYQFKQLSFEDNDNLKTNLTPNIEFIFGPPGTGKTTYLARNVLIPKMKESKDLKILVLTPTNKAADVLTKRIMQECGDDESYYSWLARFGITQDKDIEQSEVLKYKDFDIRRFSRNVTITTIARFPYDSFTPENLDFPLHLRQLEWDYIVIDEASMIMLAQIMYPLCHKCDSQFIIAGDPFQIQPITWAEEWKNENIYTLVGLNSFKKPATVPYDYNVINLETQYRSVPSIGNVFSQFTYNGILKHNRAEESQKPLNIDSLELKSLNLIKFPVSRWDGIYRSNRLNKTSYHIYSALFTYEFAKYLSAQIAKNHTEEYRIGVICPYKAQASLIEGLINDKSFPKFEKINLQVGTIHKFQGDECDIVISLFNPPPTISSSSDMFLNNQNILNVSISRARDYLFVLTPDDQTENLHNLEKINKIEHLIKASSHFEIHSKKVEKIIFGNENYLKANSFPTTHQSINVYSEADNLYEFRCDDTSIDVQIKPTLTGVLA